MGKKRTDAERRARQCERLSRLLRTLHLIMGAGRWDAKALARELECSERTVHRLIQTLGFANVPVYYDQAHQAYRVRRGFKFPGIDVPRQNLDSSPNESAATVDNMEPAVKQILSDGEAFLKSIRTFLRQLKKN